MLARRGGTMNSLTYKSINGLPTQHAVAVAVLAIRPDQAFIAAKRQHPLAKKCWEFAVRFIPLRRVSMPTPSAPMGITPTSRTGGLIAAIDRTDRPSAHGIVMRAAEPALKGWLAAILNRAYRGISHFDLLQRLAWLEPVAALERSAGSLFVPSSAAGDKI